MVRTHARKSALAGDTCSEQEALRVIAPIRGRAWRGETMLKKPELPGSDWWTHRTRGADKDWMSKISAKPKTRNANIAASSSLMVAPETLMFAQTGNVNRPNDRGFAYAREDGRELWSVDLPGEPLLNGTAPAADGSWVLTLRDGSLAIVSSGEWVLFTPEYTMTTSKNSKANRDPNWSAPGKLVSISWAIQSGQRLTTAPEQNPAYGEVTHRAKPGGWRTVGHNASEGI